MTLYGWTHVIIHLSKCTEYSTPRVFTVGCGLGVIVRGLYRFTSCSKCTALLSDLDNGEGYACGGREDTGNLCIFCLIFAVGLKLL